MSIILNESLLKKVGERIKEIRESKKISKEELGFRIESHRPLITRIEKGELNSKINTLNAIAEALDIELWELLKFKK